MNYLDLFDDDAIGDRERFRQNEMERRHGPTDGDVETTAPFIGMCPDESDHENASPLDFGRSHPMHRRMVGDSLMGRADAARKADGKVSRMAIKGKR